jgi:prepilin-type N-terminal cleavage/methylation domain-containing protein
MVRNQQHDRGARTAFTLVEMIVVIGIILVLATLVAAVLSAPLLVQEKARRGGDQLQQWLRKSKSQAMADQAPRGVHLIRDPSSPDPTKPWIRELEYIEQPSDYIVMLPGNVSAGIPAQPNGLTVAVNSATTPPSGIATLATVTTPGQYDFTGGLFNGTTVQDDPNWPVHGDKIVNGVMAQPGDYLEVQGGGLLYRITNVTPSGLLLDRAPVIPMTTPTLQYRIIRQPRPLAGETPLKLPQDVIIDTGLSLPPPTNAGSGDLLFSPSGRLLGPLGAQTQVVLWVRDVTRDSPTDNSPVLVSIYARTGFIAVHPVNIAGPDFYSFTRDGRLSGM